MVKSKNFHKKHGEIREFTQDKNYIMCNNTLMYQKKKWKKIERKVNKKNLKKSQKKLKMTIFFLTQFFLQKTSDEHLDHQLTAIWIPQ